MINRKLTLFTAAALLLGASNAMAISNSDAFSRCVDSESSDAGLTKCYQNEIKYFQKMITDNIKYIKEWDLFDNLTQNEDYDLDTQYKYLVKYIDEYCPYYVQARQNDGYSNKLLEAKCRLGYIQMHAGYLTGVIHIASSGCEED